MMIRHDAPQDCRDLAERLNLDCHCVWLDREALRRELNEMPDGEVIARMIETDRPHLFSGSAVYVSERNIQRMAQLIEAIEEVVAHPAYIEHVLAYADPIARHVPAARGVFLGYDFHLPEQVDAFPQLIEINTNAGGGLLNALLARAQHAGCDCAGLALPGLLDAQTPEQLFMDMFESECRLERAGRAVGLEQPERSSSMPDSVEAACRTIAIVDDAPESQYLYPEFLLFCRLFERHGYRTLICDPKQLERREGGLWCGDERIDLIYNRLTDFTLTEATHDTLKEAWLAGEVVLTPHPHAHALYADKRNLIALSDDALLEKWGLPQATRHLLQQGIPKTRLVLAEQAEILWAQRRQLFFKPASGYGSKAAYRGDKLTRRVFDEIIHGDLPYIHQKLTPPTSRQLPVDGVATSLKLDLRNYVYEGCVQLVAARLWQGQTTNFRTPGGGFAPVMAVPCPENLFPEHSQETQT